MEAGLALGNGRSPGNLVAFIFRSGESQRR
jgi:hypothetical protein